jgi:hypothetical protein
MRFSRTRAVNLIIAVAFVAEIGDCRGSNGLTWAFVRSELSTDSGAFLEPTDGTDARIVLSACGRI